MTRLQELGRKLDDARKINQPVDDLLAQIYAELDKLAISRGIAPRYANEAYQQNNRPRAESKGV